MTKSTFLRRPSFIIPLMVIVVALALPWSRTYCLMQLGVLQTKHGYIDSLLFGTDKELVFKTPHNKWERWDQLIATVQFKPEENYTDRYIESHPQYTWLVAERIRELLNHYGTPNRGEESYMISQYPIPDKVPEKERQREIAKRKTLYPRIVKLCRLGQQQEPQNAYYDLVLSLVSYGLFKDDDGWRYFESASRKSGFDPHYQDLMHVQLSLDRHIVGHPLITSEKDIASSVVLFRDTSSFWRLSRWLQWWASRDIHNGNIPKAMKTMQTMHRLGSLITRHAQENYTSSVGTQMAILAAQTPWKALQKAYPLPGPPQKRVSVEQRYYYSQQFAEKHHLPELSQLIDSSFQLNYYRLRALDRDNQARLGIGDRAVMIISWNIGVWMLAWMIGAAVILLLSLRYIHRSQPRSGALRYVPPGISITVLLSSLVLFYWLWLGSEADLHRNLGPDVFYANIPLLGGIVVRAAVMLMPFIVAFIISWVTTYFVYRKKLKERRHTSIGNNKAKVLLRIFKSPRTPLKRQYWNSIFCAVQTSLSCVLIVSAVLYAGSLTIATVSEQRAAQRLEPLFYKNGLRYYADPEDLTVQLTPAEFYKYQKQWAKRNTSNRIDW